LGFEHAKAACKMIVKLIIDEKRKKEIDGARLFQGSQSFPVMLWN